jgi:predicted O-methyltransferase YrrM
MPGPAIVAPTGPFETRRTRVTRARIVGATSYNRVMAGRAAQIDAARNALRRGGPLLLTGSALRYLSDRTITFAAKRALARQRSTIRTIEDALDTAFAFEDWNVIAPNQIRPEIEALLDLLATDAPRGVLEIGTARGGTLFLLAYVASDDATLISIDLRYSGPCGNAGYPPAFEPLFNSFAREQQVIELIRGDSHSDETRAEVERVLGQRAVDFLLIDGDHTETGVRRDFTMYSPLVRRDGYIALHDIVPGRRELSGGVPDFWNDLKASQSTQEFVRDWKQGAYGIGVIKKKTDYGTVA